jgi:hypothetical protein
MTSSLLGVTYSLYQSFLFAPTKHLKCPLDHHFYVSLLNTTLGLPTKGGKPLHKGEVISLQRTILDTHLKCLDWLIQVRDLIWWVTLNPFLSSFLSTCLSPFLSINDFQLLLEFKPHLHFEFDLDLPIWVPNVCQVYFTIKWPCTHHLSCF